MSLEYFQVSSVPDKPFDRHLFLETVGNNPFIIVYDLESKLCMLAMDSLVQMIPKLVSSALPGLDFKRAESFRGSGNLHVLSLYRSIESIPLSFMSEIFDMGMDGFLCIAFVPQGEKEFSHAREQIERKLGRISVARGYSVSDSGIGKRTSTSVQHKDFAKSDESTLLGELLESLNRSVTANGIAYKIAFATPNAGIKEYVLQRLALLESHTFKGDLEELMVHVERSPSLSFGGDFASALVNFYGSVSTSYTIPARFMRSEGDIALGRFMKDSVHETDDIVKIGSSLLNLGFIISGLPGSGKTREAMSVIDSVIKSGGHARVVVISPTDEWDSFALSHGMNLVRVCDDRIPINFFRCPDGSDVRRFYESLAMILSSASAAGPYRNPMEKCMLNAFRRVYQNTGTPDPITVHSQIEESVIRMHAKRTNAGIKYTKHGENIKSSMENFVDILQMQEYSEQRGICIEELIGKGIVFDLSRAGVETKPYFYALLLNQVYSIASTFDSNGDEELRLLICLEEAQMMLKDQKSPVVEDMRYRIQDFRKKGIGLMLLAHNTSDIDVGIRRLCQVKIYLKQAADVAETAASDLVFSFVKSEDVASKLKHLDSRIGALSYMSKEDGMKVSRDTIFIKTVEYFDAPSLSANPILEYAKKRRIFAPKMIKSSIIVGPVINDATNLRMSYLGEELLVVEVDAIPTVFQVELVEGREYAVELLDKRDRIVRAFSVIAQPEMRIDLDAAQREGGS